MKKIIHFILIYIFFLLGICRSVDIFPYENRNYEDLLSQTLSPRVSLNLFLLQQTFINNKNSISDYTSKRVYSHEYDDRSFRYLNQIPQGFAPGEIVKIRAIVMDIDATITKDGKSFVYENNLEAIERALEEGIPVLLISGAPLLKKVTTRLYLSDQEDDFIEETNDFSMESLEDRIIKFLQQRIKNKKILKNLTIMGTLGSESVTFDNQGNYHYQIDEEKYLRFNSIDQRELSRALSIAFLRELAKVKDISFSKVIGKIEIAENIIDIKNLFEKTVRGYTDARFWRFNPILDITAHDNLVSGHRVLDEALKILEKNKYSCREHGITASSGDDYANFSRVRKSDRVSSWLEGVEASGAVLGLGDSTLDTFLFEDVAGSLYFPMFLSQAKRAAKYRKVIVARNENGQDNCGYKETANIIIKFLNAAKNKKLYSELQFFDNQYSLEDLAQQKILNDNVLGYDFLTSNYGFSYQSAADVNNLFNLGFEVEVLNVGDISIGANGSEKLTIFGRLAKAVWKTFFKETKRNRVDLGMNTLLLKRTSNQKTNEYIIIDPGFSPKAIIAELKKRNIHREQISTVILTHAHYDHAGALTYYDEEQGEWLPTFPEAKVYIDKQMLVERKEDRKFITGKHDSFCRDFRSRDIRGVLLKENLLFGLQDMDIPGINMKFSNGHSENHAVFEIGFGRRKLIIAGDELPIALHSIKPDLNSATDNFDKTYLSRRYLIEKAAVSKSLIFFYHGSLGKDTRENVFMEIESLHNPKKVILNKAQERKRLSMCDNIAKGDNFPDSQFLIDRLNYLYSSLKPVREHLGLSSMLKLIKENEDKFQHDLLINVSYNFKVQNNNKDVIYLAIKVGEKEYLAAMKFKEQAVVFSEILDDAQYISNNLIIAPMTNRLLTEYFKLQVLFYGDLIRPPDKSKKIVLTSGRQGSTVHVVHERNGRFVLKIPRDVRLMSNTVLFTNTFDFFIDFNKELARGYNLAASAGSERFVLGNIVKDIFVRKDLFTPETLETILKECADSVEIRDEYIVIKNAIFQRRGIDLESVLKSFYADIHEYERYPYKYENEIETLRKEAFAMIDELVVLIIHEWQLGYFDGDVDIFNVLMLLQDGHLYFYDFGMFKKVESTPAVRTLYYSILNSLGKIDERLGDYFGNNYKHIFTPEYYQNIRNCSIDMLEVPHFFEYCSFERAI